MSEANETGKASIPVERIVMPLIRCTCVCDHVWDVAFVPWSFRLQDAFRCLSCKKWCKSVQLFRDGDTAPHIEVEA